MGRGLSPQQRAILDVLDRFPRCEEVVADPERPTAASTGRVIDALGLDRNRGNFESVSKSLRRLVDRGLVVAVDPEAATHGGRRRYAKKGFGVPRP